PRAPPRNGSTTTRWSSDRAADDGDHPDGTKRTIPLIFVRPDPPGGSPSVRGSGRISPLWRRAPTVLLRYRWLLASIVFGALLLSSTATAYPLFISATEATLAKASLTDPTVTSYGAGVEYRIQNLDFDHPEIPPAGIDRLFKARIA